MWLESEQDEQQCARIPTEWKQVGKVHPPPIFVIFVVELVWLRGANEA